MDIIDLSIVIVSWNTRELLRECLYSIYQYTKGIRFEVFVVDNASSDGSEDMVKQSFPEVVIISNLENVGFSKANNQAIIISRGRYIALLNPDTLLIEDVFSPLIKYADQHVKIGTIGPKIFNRDGQTIQYVCARKLPNLYSDFCRLSGLANKFPGSKVFDEGYMSYWDHNSSRYVKALSGSCMVVRRKAIDDVGLMDEHQFMYGDEIDWCKRFLDAGWDIYYDADSSIIHYGGESSKQANVFISKEAEKSIWYYYKKHKGGIYASAYCVQLGLVSMFKFIWTLLFRIKRDRERMLMEVYKNNFYLSIQMIIGR